MNFQSGHKRINSYSGQNTTTYSGHKSNPRNTIIQGGNIGSNLGNSMGNNINLNLPLQKKSASKESFGNNIKIIHSAAGSNSAAKHGKGSIIYQNLPLKYEGDLLSKNQIQNVSRDNSRNNMTSRVPNDRDNSQGINSGNTVNSTNMTRSLSPNIIGKNINIKLGSTTSVNFKSNPSLGKPSMTLNRFKKLDLPTSSASSTKGMTKKTKSYYIPKSARDNLNLSNISGISGNKNKFGETKDSFGASINNNTGSNSNNSNYNPNMINTANINLIGNNYNNNNINNNINNNQNQNISQSINNNPNSNNNVTANINDILNRSRGIKPLTSFNNINLNRSIGNLNYSLPGARSTTPNAKSSRNSKLSDSKFTKSNNDLHARSAKKSPITSKSPNSRQGNTSTSNSRKTSFLNSNNINNGSKFSPGPVIRSAFDSSLIKQLNDFKNNKSPTPNILKKITNNPKIMNITAAKFGAPNVKKVITGNLINMNMNVNVTNLNVNIPNADSNNSSKNTGVSNASAFTINNSNNTVRKDSKDNNSKDFANKDDSNNFNYVNNLNNNNRSNLHKEKEAKGPVDFKEITTSPLIRVKLF
jgi:hypothetical protein